MGTEPVGWYLVSAAQEPDGPYTTEDLCVRLARGQRSPATLCCCEGMTAWAPLDSLPQFAGQAPPVVNNDVRVLPAPPPPPKRRVPWLLLLAPLAVAALLVVLLIAYQGYLAYDTAKALHQARNAIATDHTGDAAALLERVGNRRYFASTRLYLEALCAVTDAANSTPDADTTGGPFADTIPLFRRAFAHRGSRRDDADRDLGRLQNDGPGKDDLALATDLAKLRVELGVTPRKRAVQELADHLRPAAEDLVDGGDVHDVAVAIAWAPELADRAVDLVAPADDDAWMQPGPRRGICASLAAESAAFQQALAHAVTARARMALDEGQLDRVVALMRTGRELNQSFTVPDLDAAFLRACLDRVAAGMAVATIAELLAGFPWTSPAMQRSAGRKIAEWAAELKDAALARQLVDLARQLAPNVTEDADSGALAIVLAEPGRERQEEARQQLAGETDRDRRRSLLLTIVNEGIVADTAAALADANDAMLTLLRDAPEAPDLDVLCLELAPKVRRWLGVTPALTLLETVGREFPGSQHHASFASLADQWNPLPPYLRAIEKQLRDRLHVLHVRTGEDLDALTTTPPYQVVHFAPDATADRFTTPQLQELRNWIRHGGHAWVATNVIDALDIRATAQAARAVTRQATRTSTTVAAPETPFIGIATDCRRVTVAVVEDARYDLACYGRVQPLLLGHRDADGPVAIWSIIPYGDGTISDVKPVILEEGDGARFWLNFRLFCVGLPIPGDITPVMARIGERLRAEFPEETTPTPEDLAREFGATLPPPPTRELAIIRAEIMAAAQAAVDKKIPAPDTAAAAAEYKRKCPPIAIGERVRDLVVRGPRARRVNGVVAGISLDNYMPHIVVGTQSIPLADLSAADRERCNPDTYARNLQAYVSQQVRPAAMKRAALLEQAVAGALPAACTAGGYVRDAAGEWVAARDAAVTALRQRHQDERARAITERRQAIEQEEYTGAGFALAHGRWQWQPPQQD